MKLNDVLTERCFLKLTAPVILITGLFFFYFDKPISLDKEALPNNNSSSQAVEKNSEDIVQHNHVEPINADTQTTSLIAEDQMPPMSEILKTIEAEPIAYIYEQVSSDTYYSDEVTALLEKWVNQGLMKKSNLEAIRAANGLDENMRITRNKYTANFSPETLISMSDGDIFSVPLNNVDHAKFMVLERIDGNKSTTISTINLDNHVNANFKISYTENSTKLLGSYNLDNIAYQFQSLDENTLSITEQGP